MLYADIRAELFQYMADIAKRESSYVHEIGGVDDHVHILLTLPRTMPLAKLVELIKKDSSKWLKRQRTGLMLFAWQSGYGAFSVSASQIQIVRSYIREQETHHRKWNFQTEIRAFLKTANVPFDEKYLWD